MNETQNDLELIEEMARRARKDYILGDDAEAIRWLRDVAAIAEDRAARLERAGKAR